MEIRKVMRKMNNVKKIRNISKEIFLNAHVCPALGWLTRAGELKEKPMPASILTLEAISSLIHSFTHPPILRRSVSPIRILALLKRTPAPNTYKTAFHNIKGKHNNIIKTTVKVAKDFQNEIKRLREKGVIIN